MIGYVNNGPNNYNCVTKLCKYSYSIIDSNLRNATKAHHVPKRDMCTKYEFASKQ